MSSKVGLVGIGRLGTALMKHWCENKIGIGVYHPSRLKADQFIQKFPNGYLVNRDELGRLDYLILALSAKDTISFISGVLSSYTHKAHFVNMATTLYTKELKERFSNIKITGIKYMGHSRDLLDYGNGLFITESPLTNELESLFQYLGRVVIDSEETLNEVNKVATYHAIKASMEIESIMSEKGLSPDYVERALVSMAPQVMKSYYEGNLGHFAKEIIKEIQTQQT